MTPVRKRRVFYIAGFDPRGPLYYHKLYKSECEQQSAVNGLAASVGRRRNIDAIESAWRVETPATVTDYSFLRWDDIVRARWPAGATGMIAGILGMTWTGLRSGVLAMLLRNSWPCFICAILPFAFLAGVVLAGLILAGVALALLDDLWGYAAAALILAGAAALVRPVLGRFNVTWMTGSGVFMADQVDGASQDIDARAAAFAERIAAAIQAAGEGEILVVSHSVGIVPAIKTLARLATTMPAAAELSYLSLGQQLAMAAYQPKAQALRRDLAAVAAQPNIRWIDVTAAIDGSCIPLSDPLAICGVARPQAAPVYPKLISARFVKLFTTEGYKRVRRKFLRAHFQYLLASELPGVYDYFLITAGDRRLWDRFAEHKSVTGFDRLRLKFA